MEELGLCHTPKHRKAHSPEPCCHAASLQLRWPQNLLPCTPRSCQGQDALLPASPDVGCTGAWLKMVVADTNQAAKHANRKLHKKTIEKRRKPAASTVWPFLIPSNAFTLCPQNAFLRLSCHCLASGLSTSPGTSAGMCARTHVQIFMYVHIHIYAHTHTHTHGSCQNPHHLPKPP